MGEKMNLAPVYFVIVQARFNPILALESYAPAIQDDLRRHGFPDAKTGTLNTFNLTLGPPLDGVTQGQVPVTRVARYEFLNAERTSGFILDQGALSFQTTDYDVFETFSKQFIIGLEIIHKAVELNYTDRLGLRYLDAVLPKIDEDLSTYLNERVLGLSEYGGSQIVHSFSETVFRVRETNMTARAVIQDGPLGFPPDLLPQPLALPERFQSLKGKHAVLDTDGSVERRETLNVGAIADRLSVIHDQITSAFKAMVTEHALKVWA
jgi:uncharacterized protein (TIGR04255 family)